MEKWDTKYEPLDEVVHPAELLVRAVLIATKPTEVVLQLARIGRDREPASEPVLGHLPPPLLVRVELHKARGLLPDAGDVVHVDRGSICDGVVPDASQLPTIADCHRCVPAWARL